MRKQYHFRQVGEDTHIWDVHRLVELSQKFQIIETPLTGIRELNEAYWFPDTHPTTQQIIEHIQLIEAADLSYPVILCAEGRVMDGMHRIAKARLMNLATIKAVRIGETPQPDYINIHEDELEYDD
ncbi:hypothetical protein CDG60_15000 [Acinetobacter chinensis]|uniref:Chromosome partitioning protein ParB n=1 Tax=Acinetobacter chinensis TaxID=2004650 RepID=A0A3B7LY58_9GAMM|nr:hypothetical protein [Acinetobacter chinensis]AXY57752.1 hypothetical protein CDG60_15000 [Acinetobacter chinensis]